VHWSELGLDSLALTQLAIELRKAFGVALTLRDLSGEVGTPAAVAARVRAAVPTALPAAVVHVAGSSSAPMPTPTSAPGVQRPNPGVKIERSTSERFRLDAAQRAYLDGFLARYAERTARSKAHAQQHRAYLADPRTVTGFHPLWKEIVYPIVTERSRGARLWDLDGNEYVDLLNGFGSVLFGHSPEFVNDAIVRQIERGVEIGPQTVLAGEVARLVRDLTGHERVAFTNTGSEAVLAALRLARTVTGRERVVAFDGSYHGIFDEALARPDGRGGVRAASPGIPSGYVDAMTVLPYADPASLATIERLGGELAAVLVEPIQGRNPDVQPREFLLQLRELTRRHGIALVFDEVVTGFRAHAAGVQGLYGIDADIATYGKVVAGGHPIGLLAGRARFLDALDGGDWRFGDDSVPEAGVTFFAGTFVRHPLALAAAKANLERIAAESPGLQTELAAKTARLVAALRATLAATGVGIRLGSAHSTFFLSAAPDEPWAPLLFAQLRYRGFHLWEQFPSFVTVAHQEADLAAFAAAFAESIDELQRHGLLGRARQGAHADVATAPRPDARLGRRRDGSLAWFVPDPQRPGKFVEVGDARVS
jgi:glutamate-1-semialdehyde aminotransferase